MRCEHGVPANLKLFLIFFSVKVEGRDSKTSKISQQDTPTNKKKMVLLSSWDWVLDWVLFVALSNHCLLFAKTTGLKLEQDHVLIKFKYIILRYLHLLILFILIVYRFGTGFHIVPLFCWVSY